MQKLFQNTGDLHSVCRSGAAELKRILFSLNSSACSICHAVEFYKVQYAVVACNACLNTAQRCGDSYVLCVPDHLLPIQPVDEDGKLFLVRVTEAIRDKDMILPHFNSVDPFFEARALRVGWMTIEQKGPWTYVFVRG